MFVSSHTLSNIHLLQICVFVALERITPLSYREIDEENMSGDILQPFPFASFILALKRTGNTCTSFKHRAGFTPFAERSCVCIHMVGNNGVVFV